MKVLSVSKSLKIVLMNKHMHIYIYIYSFIFILLPTVSLLKFDLINIFPIRFIKSHVLYNLSLICILKLFFAKLTNFNMNELQFFMVPHILSYTTSFIYHRYITYLSVYNWYDVCFEYSAILISSNSHWK